MCDTISTSGEKGMIWLYQIGEKVLYGVHGVCMIRGKETRRVDRKTVEYYVLEPIDSSGASFYVPTGNPAACAKMKPVLTKDQIDALLLCDGIRADCWIDDENLRKNRYRELIVSGDRFALLSMIHTLVVRKKELLAAGRKFHLCDENFLRDAEKVISGEFAEVLGIGPNEVSEYILQKMQMRI